MSRKRSQDRVDAVKERMGGLTSIQKLTGARDSAHPLGADFGFKNPRDYLLIDPNKIELQGPYVRSWFVDDEFEAFCQAVRENGDIGQPIGIRTVGQGMEKRYVLIYGMRRWKAALAAGLERIPVRDYGEIPEEESLHLQLVENEARSNPHPVDTAYSFHLAVEQGRSQADICRTTGRDSGYVSYMRAVGEAIALLSDEERQRLYPSPKVTVRAIQELAKIPGVQERRAALLALATEADSTTARAVRTRLEQEKSPVQVRETRQGRSFRVQLRDDDLRADPEGLSDALLAAFAREQELLAERLRALEAKHRRTGRRAPKKEADPDALARAAERVERAAERMQRALEDDDTE